jgi:tetratricopeptide (TPR) repeat protein/tRNA A-37 threonylcarbamoyl transferase component Bud32
MDAQRWERLQSLFHEALAQPVDERAAFVRATCAHDPDLGKQLMGLLDADARSVPQLDRGMPEMANALLDELPELATLGPYRIIKPLGVGGMGVVYLAERSDIGGLVAIKLLRDAALSPARRQRFAAEQRALARLSHPNIARLYDAGTLPDGTPYFVMEYVAGQTLTSYSVDASPNIAQMLALFRALCEAVQFVHRHAIVHRDLKPSNVLVTNDGAVKLLDFGISKQLDDTDSPIEQTQTGMRLLTPAYAAPEQVWGEPVGTYTDIYTLGVILYELLAGTRPFTSEATLRPEALLLREEATRPSATAARTQRWQLSRAEWADLDVLCLTAMQKDPQRRYRTVDALIRDLDHFQKREPLDARPDTLRYRAGKFMRRNRRQVIAASFALVALASLAGFYTVRLAAARDAAVAEAARTQRIQRFMLSLFQGGDPAAGPSDTLRVVTVADRGLREASVLDREPAVQAELYATLGGIYQQLGKLARADSLLQNALRQRRARTDASAAEISGNLVALGMLRIDQAQLEEAEQLVRQGLETAERELPANHPTVVKARTALGRVLMERGEYEQAIIVLNDAMRSNGQSKPDTLILIDILRQLADTHFYTGNYTASDSLNQTLLGMHRRIYGEKHPLIADDLLNLGATQYQRGEYAQAERFDRMALDINASFYGTDHPAYASNLTMLGRALVFQDKYDEAVVVLTRSLEIQERVYGRVHPKVASALNELGNVATSRNDVPAAEAYFQRMGSIYRAVYGEEHRLVALAIANLASAYMRAGENARAEPLFRDAVRRYAKALSPDHLDVGIARIKLGRVLTRQNRFAEAEPEILAGYDIVKKQTTTGASFLKAARTDLITVYEGLGMPQKAARYRAELADSIPK